MSNYGTFRNRAKALSMAIVITVVFAMLPVSLLGWTSDVSDLVRVPVTPISHVGMMIKSWVRPAIEPSDLPTDEQERNKLAVAERDHYRQLYHSQMLRAEELADQLRILQLLPKSALRNPAPPLVVQLDLTGIKPNDDSSIVELKLSRGVSKRILDGDIAIVGRDIVGRIVRVSMTRVELLPTTHKESGYVKAGIVPAHPLQGNRHPHLSKTHLKPTSEGLLAGEISLNVEVQEGDLVVLDDPVWSVSGNGLVLGVITSIYSMDEAPLRKVVEVTPRQRARDHDRVVVLGSGEVDKK